MFDIDQCPLFVSNVKPDLVPSRRLYHVKLGVTAYVWAFTEADVKATLTREVIWNSISEEVITEVNYGDEIERSWRGSLPYGDQDASPLTVGELVVFSK